MDYLIEEVFQRQPEPLQNFLLQTSILDRLSGPFCDAVTGRHDSHEIILAMEKTNLFIFPLDEVRQWYRYHHLFADLLRVRLHQQKSGMSRELHLRASKWYQQNGLLSEAVDHALAAEAWSRAADLMERSLAIPMYRQGRYATLQAWLEKLPESELQAKPDLCLWHAWALLISNRREQYEQPLRVAERVWQSQGNTSKLAQVHVIRGMEAYFKEEAQETIALAAGALRDLAEDDRFNRGIAHLLLVEWLRAQQKKGSSPAFASESAARLITVFPSELSSVNVPPSKSPVQLPAAYLVDSLSKRELEILQLVAQGLPNERIARKLYLATSTVKRHINNIYAKLNVHSRTQALAKAKELKVLSD